MTLPLPGNQVDDYNMQQKFDAISLNWPVMPRTIFGIVGATGAVQQTGSNNWTSVRTALGQYTITFNKAFPNVNYAPAITLFGGVALVDVVGINATNLQYWVINVAGAFVDSAAAFHVLGPGA